MQKERTLFSYSGHVRTRAQVLNALNATTVEVIVHVIAVRFQGLFITRCLNVNERLVFVMKDLADALRSMVDPLGDGLLTFDEFCTGVASIIQSTSSGGFCRHLFLLFSWGMDEEKSRTAQLLPRNGENGREGNSLSGEKSEENQCSLLRRARERRERPHVFLLLFDCRSRKMRSAVYFKGRCRKCKKWR